MGKCNLPGAYDIGSPRLRPGRGMEIPSRERTSDPRTGSGFVICSREPHTEDGIGVRSDLSDIEREIDSVLQAQRVRERVGEENALDAVNLNVAAHRLQSLIHDRRTLLTVEPSKIRVKRADVI